MKIFFDPGHGGRDSGAIGPNGVKESFVALKIAQYAHDYTNALGHQALLSRAADTKTSLMNRCLMANKTKADIFVSIHCNAASTQDATGFEVWYHNSSVNGQKAAEGVVNALKARLPDHKERGARNDSERYTNGLYVLRRTQMPAILVEVEFISNPDMEKFLDNDNNQRIIAEAIVDGVITALEQEVA